MKQLIDIYKDTIILQQQIYINLLESNLRNMEILRKLEEMTQGCV